MLKIAKVHRAENMMAHWDIQTIRGTSHFIASISWHMKEDTSANTDINGAFMLLLLMAPDIDFGIVSMAYLNSVLNWIFVEVLLCAWHN